MTACASLDRLGLIDARTGDDRRALLAYALDHLDLTLIDYLTIGDLLGFTHLPEQETLPLEMLLLALCASLRDGSLCLPLQAEAVQRYFPDFPRAAAWFDAFQQHRDRYAAVLSCDSCACVPLIIRQEQDREYLYFQRYARAAEVINAQVHQRCGVPGQPVPALDAILADLVAELRLRQFSLSDEQQQAIRTVASHSFTVITGGPGTGKTTLVFLLLRCLVRLGLVTAADIALAAPTGRAAQRLTESLRSYAQGLPVGCTAEERQLCLLVGKTIHRLLGYQPWRHGFRHDADTPLPVKVLVVDEVSMIDATLMAALLAAVPKEATVILLGDPHQLPSVDAGAVLSDLLPTGQQAVQEPHVARLCQSHRSGSAILTVAEIVNAYQEGDRARLLEALRQAPQCRLIDATGATPDHWQHELQAWAAQHYCNSAYLDAVKEASTSPAAYGDLFTHLREAQILTVTREGRSGSGWINGYLAGLLREALGVRGRDGWIPGMPVIVTRNDYTLPLFNGDTGVVLGQGGNLFAVFPQGEDFVTYPLYHLPGPEPAFAITVHKSQGSEYGHVLLVLPEAQESAGVARLLTREIIYTGLTRAKETAVIYAPAETLCAACARRVVRESGLSLWH